MRNFLNAARTLRYQGNHQALDRHLIVVSRKSVEQDSIRELKT